VSYVIQRPENQVVRESQGIRQKSQDVSINVVNSAGDAAQPHVFVNTPDRRISSYLEVYFDPEPGTQPITSFAGSIWTVDARTTGKNFGNLPLHTLEAAKAIPRAFELTSNIKISRYVATCNVPLDTSAVLVPGRWIARAYWTPNLEMEDKELVQLFSRCQLFALFTRDV